MSNLPIPIPKSKHQIHAREGLMQLLECINCYAAHAIIATEPRGDTGDADALIKFKYGTFL